MFHITWNSCISLFWPVPRDTFGLSWVIGWWDQHLIRAFSQGNLNDIQTTDLGRQRGDKSRAGARWSLSEWDVHGKKRSQGDWESVERRACVETDGAGVLLCAYRKPSDANSCDFRRESRCERWLVFTDTDCNCRGNGKILLRTSVNIPRCFQVTVT